MSHSPAHLLSQRSLTATSPTYSVINSPTTATHSLTHWMSHSPAHLLSQCSDSRCAGECDIESYTHSQRSLTTAPTYSLMITHSLTHSMSHSPAHLLSQRSLKTSPTYFVINSPTTTTHSLNVTLISTPTVIAALTHHLTHVLRDKLTYNNHPLTHSLNVTLTSTPTVTVLTHCHLTHVLRDKLTYNNHSLTQCHTHQHTYCHSAHSLPPHPHTLLSKTINHSHQKITIQQIAQNFTFVAHRYSVSLDNVSCSKLDMVRLT